MIDWQKRFNEQLTWTESLRKYIFQKIDINSKNNLLEIGCGPGELLKDIGSQYKPELYGIDIDKDRIEIAKDNLRKNGIKAKVFHQDILENKFADEMFQVIVTNYLFLWVKDLKKAFEEIYRILEEDGILIIFSEPDYGGLIEYPNTNIKEAICENLIKAGADPNVGRKLNQYFNQKFDVVEKFCLSLPWLSNDNKENLLKEVDFFSTLLREQLYLWNPETTRICIEKSHYFMFIPTFSYYLKKIRLYK